MIHVTVGIDIAKRKFDVARLENGKFKHKKFDNTAEGFAALVAWLVAFGGASPLVCMEATGAYSIPLAEYLTQAGYSVSVINPAKIKGFAKSELSRVKTDKADAKLIARYALEKQPPHGTRRPAISANYKPCCAGLKIYWKFSKWSKTGSIPPTLSLPAPLQPISRN